LLSQSPKPAAHESTLHAPLPQPATAWDRLQIFAQAPQFFGSPSRLVSQPSAGSPLQSSEPKLHAKPQRPAMQVAIALGTAGHAWAQVPQWTGLPAMSCSQPLAGLLSQSPKPAPQDATV